MKSDKNNNSSTCSAQLDVLGDEYRLQILHQLLHKPMSVSEINASLRIKQNLLSHHLKVLRESGYISSERVGKSVHYTLTDKVQKKKNEMIVQIGCCELKFNKQKEVSL